VAAGWDGHGNPAEEIVLSELAGCGFDHDFIGLRVGDLNDSFGAAAGARNAGRSSDFASARPVSLDLEDKVLSAGEVFSLLLTVAGLSGFVGGQASVRWGGAALNYLGQSSSQLKVDRNFRRGADYLWMSWSDDLAADELLSIEFLALKEGKVSDFITLACNQGFEDEIYDLQLTPHPLFLRWNASDDENDLSQAVDQSELFASEISELLGVIPNPARTFTRVGVLLGQEQSVRLVVTDLSGRRLMESAQYLGLGEQWLRIDVEGLSAGVYLFALETTDGLLTGKIVRQ
jgi:hypothetical protein